MKILEVESGHQLWPCLVRHLQDTNNWQWLQQDGKLRNNLYVLAAVDGDAICGHISLIKQPLKLPYSCEEGFLGEPDSALTIAGKPLWETFVQTFFVAENFRGRGIGTQLQLAAVAKTRELGCYQMRSWSSYDKKANYAVKLRLGFAFHPAVHVTDKGTRVAGGYFIKTVEPQLHE